MNPSLKHPRFIMACVFGLMLFSLAYSGFFHNDFEFDDDHTIQRNTWIRDLSNIPHYFGDATTTSLLPNNQAWRPGLTTLNAIDYAIAGKEVPEPFWFRVHIFIGAILSGLMLFALLFHILEKADPARKYNHWLALFGTTFFMVHTANAETINYIIARSDVASTFWILAAFCTYIFIEKSRRWLLYMIPVAIGFSIKEPALMFVPLLYVYEWMFGEKVAGRNMRLAISAGIAVLLFIISRSLTPDHWDPGGTSRWNYLITQPFVIVHYIANFVLPLNLAVDTDWTVVTSIFDDRFLYGLLAIAALVFAFVRSAKQQKLKPIAFGIAWFLIALAPTSSLIPFSEVLNDHRVYFPYIGLVLVVTNGLGLLVDTLQTEKFRSKATTYTRGVVVVSVLFLGAHVYGTMQRVKVWSGPNTLWKDCAMKCPKNGRGLMNYGNQLLGFGTASLKAGDYESANRYYAQADSMYSLAISVWPDYFNIYVNIGSLREWQDRDAEAEANYRKAVDLRADQPEAYYWLADFLVRNNRFTDANPFVNKGLELSPYHEGLIRLKDIISNQKTPQDAVTAARTNAEQNPTPENYLNLSLASYNVMDYRGCIEASRKALELKPDYVEAYNNICASYNVLHEYDSAVVAGKKAVELAPGNELFVNNLNEALRGQAEQKK